jgi:hypothetical protein
MTNKNEFRLRRQKMIILVNGNTDFTNMIKCLLVEDRCTEVYVIYNPEAFYSLYGKVMFLPKKLIHACPSEIIPNRLFLGTERHS